MMKRPAQIVAAMLEVLCPYCAEPQPSPDNGADMWTPGEVRQEQGPKTCVSCDKGFSLM